MIGESKEDEVFAARVAAKLREPAHADAAFVERVMAGVVGLVTEGNIWGWWRRARTLRYTPVAVLAMAAGLVIAAAGLSLLSSRGPNRAAVVATKADTVYLVRFVLTSERASAVTLVGSFNDWTRGAAPMVRQNSGGVWAVTLPLRDGRHEYAFIVHDARGERWVADSAALIRRDEFGTESSIVAVGST